ncbi:PulJ/GspJ family protein [Pelagicoccus mobilis]|uniref:Prepilin-type N-terminal cleavage/methylation domain-containing protein n=2 Tax=Pelagicoccus mobilis TaxID=415221 RepID=A0A934S5U8_9BACT|nr:prepilin-type N-terminal cleavage/methylation domain-containing protein [Pelagicoccus mobilis]MBK1879939.1 prepilin-type N-terminal cleavage/methylation domain-containing protein [Pelagicoccus mobilis]
MNLPSRTTLNSRSLRRRSRPRSKRAGFTLVEMMVAMVVTGMVLTAAFGTINLSVKTMEKARDYARVAQILQSEMEDLRTLSYSNIEAMQTTAKVEWEGKFYDGWTSIDLTSEFNEAFGNRYSAWVRVSDRSSNQKLVRVWVSWQRRDGSWQAKRTAAVFTENGLHDYYYRSF